MYNIEQILNTQIGELSSHIKVGFKKTVKVGDFETEASTVDIEVDVENTSGADKAMIYALLEAQAEHTVLTQILKRGHIRQEVFNSRMIAIEKYIETIAAEYMSITGKDPLSKYGLTFDFSTKAGVDAKEEAKHREEVQKKAEEQLAQHQATQAQSQPGFGATQTAQGQPGFGAPQQNYTQPVQNQQQQVHQQQGFAQPAQNQQQPNYAQPAQTQKQPNYGQPAQPQTQQTQYQQPVPNYQNMTYQPNTVQQAQAQQTQGYTQGYTQQNYPNGSSQS